MFPFLIVAMSMADFDPTVFERYYNRAEPFPDINLQQKWTRSSLLTRVQQLLSDYPPLLSRQLRPSWGQTEEGMLTQEGALKEACNIRVMQWNVLSQGQSLHHGCSRSSLLHILVGNCERIFHKLRTLFLMLR